VHTRSWQSITSQTTEYDALLTHQSVNVDEAR
jgi:hypothetical protein